MEHDKDDATDRLEKLAIDLSRPIDQQWKNIKSAFYTACGKKGVSLSIIDWYEIEEENKNNIKGKVTRLFIDAYTFECLSLLFTALEKKIKTQWKRALSKGNGIGDLLNDEKTVISSMSVHTTEDLISEGLNPPLLMEKNEMLNMHNLTALLKKHCNISDDEKKLAQLAKLKIERTISGELTNEEIVAELVAQSWRRPSFLVKNSRICFSDIMKHNFDWVRSIEEEGVQQKIEKYFPSIGKIYYKNHKTPADHPYGGTGFLIGADIIATAAHVCSEFSYRLGDGSFDFRKDGFEKDDGTILTRGAFIEFFGEHEGTSSERCKIVEVLFMNFRNDREDIAVCRIERPKRKKLPLTFGGTYGEAKRIFVVGYPGPEYSPLYLEAQYKIYEGMYGVKRASPGEMKVPMSETLFHHDASTLGGSSGSPILNWDDGKVLGIHFQGSPSLAINFGVRFEYIKEVLDSLRRNRKIGL